MTDLFHALIASPDDRAVWRGLVKRFGAKTLLGWLSPRAIVGAMLSDTEVACAGLDHEAVGSAFPEVVALGVQAPTPVEHDPSPTGRPLLEHVSRLLGKKLRGLELGDRSRFQDREGLTAAAFDGLSTKCSRVMHAGLGPALRVAILHLDIAKTADPALRAAWAARGISLEVHNEAAVAILRAANRPASWPLPEQLGRLALAWIEAHGLAGQHIRGEGPLAMFAPLIASLRLLAPAMARVIGTTPEVAVELALDALHVLDACDTASVREGLLDDALLARFAQVREQLGTVCRAPAWANPQAALAAISPAVDRDALAIRLRALRAGRQAAGESPDLVVEAVAHIEDVELAAFAPALSTCQLWYCESATSGLSPIAQLGVLAAVVGAARKLGIDVSRPWHAQLRPLVARLHGESPAARYRLRLVEAAVAGRTIRELLSGTASLGPLGTLSARLADPEDPDAVVLDYVDTDESAALVTLLGLYETRAAVAYHTMLKALCDLYGLRKDELDRVANEANYLATMNAARTDKQRMLDFVRPGKIVEIGPGGGVVLDLLEQRYPESTILGVDLSREVVTALGARAKANHRAWTVVYGAAEDLPSIVPPGSVDTVVFCSILHEVYSYTEPKFSMASVEHVVRAAFKTLAPGGRIVIRDGVMPPKGTRRIQMIAPDCRPTFDLYVAQFEGRRIEFRELAPDRIELSSEDAMEFLYTYTWGPASFPYEVRELYGIMTYEDYVSTLVDWCGGASSCRVVDVPADLRSYLQSGYRDNLANKIALTDEHDHPVELPDSNCLIVVERI